MENRRFLTIQEASEILRCHHYTIRRLIWRKKLPYIRVGRRIRIPERAIRELEAKAMREARFAVTVES
jgi:excisionase family DNA binding protein